MRDVLAGVNGKHLCNVAHGRYLHRFTAEEWTPRRPDPVELTQHGVPFGRVCARCLKLHRARTSRGPEAKP